MASFKRKINDRQRAAMIRRKMAIAKEIGAQPTVEVVISATGRRSAGKNTVIFRTWRKRLGGLKLTPADSKYIMKATQKQRDTVHDAAPGSVGRLLNAIGPQMVKRLENKVLNKGLVDTGQLLSSLEFKVRNG